MLFLRIALLAVLFTAEARAERLQIQILDTATLNNMVAAGVKYDTGDGEESLTSNRYADLDYPRKREIRFSRTQNDIFPRTILLLENVDHVKQCLPRTVFVARQGLEFSVRAFNQSLEYLNSASCADRDRALAWYRAAFFQLNEVVGKLNAVSSGGFNPLIVEARYLTALGGACVVLGYESECVVAISQAATLRDRLIANAGKDQIDPGLADKVSWTAKETLLKAKARTASALFTSRRYGEAAQKYKDIISDCNKDLKFCAAITLTEKFLIDQLALALFKDGEQLERSGKGAPCPAYSDAYAQFELAAQLKGNNDAKTNAERDLAKTKMGLVCNTTRGGRS